MSKADEIFEKIGFNKVPVVNRLTGEEYKYDYEYINCDGTWEEHILINDSTKMIHTSNYLLSVGKEYSFILTKEKLQAINEKCKELRLDLRRMVWKKFGNQLMDMKINI